MRTGLVVLWLFSAAGFNLGPVDLGPGWYATKNIFSQDDQGWTACMTLGMEMDSVSHSVTDFACYAAGDGPPEEEWAEVLR